jgi:ubiquinone/menaquinone biosynthesis C-methylase UbiE
MSEGIDRMQLIEIYRGLAERYDVYAALLQLIGFRYTAYRKKAIRGLALQSGDTVVDVGCGTGPNFSYLERAIGPSGTIIGVDLTDAMLEQARRRAVANGWKNVRLVRSDAAAFSFPTGVDGILSTLALTLVPEYDRVILNGARALKEGGHWAIADFRMPSNVLALVAPILAWLLVRPFGGSIELATRHPWESMNKYLSNVSVSDVFLGMAYVAVGERGSLPV